MSVFFPGKKKSKGNRKKWSVFRCA